MVAINNCGGGSGADERRRNLAELFGQKAAHHTLVSASIVICDCDNCQTVAQVESLVALVFAIGRRHATGRPEMLKEVIDFMDGLIKKYPPEPESKKPK